MTTAEMTARVRAMQARWYEIRVRVSSSAADEELERAMREYMAELDASAEVR